MAAGGVVESIVGGVITVGSSRKLLGRGRTGDPEGSPAESGCPPLKSGGIAAPAGLGDRGRARRGDRADAASADAQLHPAAAAAALPGLAPGVVEPRPHR